MYKRAYEKPLDIANVIKKNFFKKQTTLVDMNWTGFLFAYSTQME